MSLSRSRVFPGVCTMAHEGVFQGAPRGGAHTSPPLHGLSQVHSPFFTCQTPNLAVKDPSKTIDFLTYKILQKKADSQEEV